ncbi:hypothetical protein EON67_08040, partial [archaeon]
MTECAQMRRLERAGGRTREPTEADNPPRHNPVSQQRPPTNSHHSPLLCTYLESYDMMPMTGASGNHVVQRAAPIAQVCGAQRRNDLF